MKADIPDSIIISRDDEGVLHHSYWTTDQQPVPFEATKFIRKDALLEWAKETQRALEKYPKRKDGQTRGYVCDDNDVRRIYSQGYRRAEKDLALTADEIRLIFNKVRIKQSMYNTTEGCYQEVADWFNEQRKK